MKKSEYINKYDFINYYTKPKGLWFFSNIEIQSFLESQIYAYKKNKNFSIEMIDDLEDDNDFEIDLYEKYKESLLENSNLDEDNLLLIQGNIIDEKSRNFIMQFFSDVNNVYDLEKKYKTRNNEKLAKLTKKYLLENDNVILFQSVFIYKNMVTKPDAVIKKDGELYVIETKGTTSSKFVHYLDLFFQMQVIEKQTYLKELDLIYNYALCLIKYCYILKNEINFEICWNINLKKNVSVPTEHKLYESLNEFELIDLKNNIKKGNAFLSEYSTSLNIKKLMYDNFDELDSNIECNKGVTRKAFNEAKSNLVYVNARFDDVINELCEHKQKMDDNSTPYFVPSYNDKSPYKNCDFFPMERKLYSLMGYKLFNYSGTISNQKAENLESTSKTDDIKDFLKQPKKNPNVFIDLFSRYKDYSINIDACENLLLNLKNKKVYFDFETLNPPIGVIDNSLPFMQIVTQCSIIKYNESTDKMEDLTCNNMIIDPQKIELSWFKDVIDNIYWGINYKQFLENKYDNDSLNGVSYIVYNKSFEKSRLKEMAKMINQKEYFFKVNNICNNLFDLADFFKVKSEHPTHIVFFNELGGFFSIKKVLPLIDKYYKDIYATTKCLDYETLEIKNGQICQNETIKRFFNIINDSEWKKVEKQMQIYCENDVRAMIAVEYFVKHYFEIEKQKRLENE